jgi:hypothetical protein
MEDEALSRATIIRDPSVGAVFANSKMRRLVMLFASAPMSVGEAALRTGTELKRLHHHVQKLVRLRLLEVAAVQPRAGRPIKLYRSTSDAFFVPEEVMPRPFGEGLALELREMLHAEASRSSQGLLWTIGPNGEPRGRVVSAEEVSPNAFELWRILRLAPGDIARLRDDLDAVLQKYQGQARSRAQVYLVHAAAAQRRDESGAPDNAIR